MLGRLRDIDDELRELPEQLGPLESKVVRVRDVVSSSEQNTPLRRPLSLLLKNTEGAHAENLGWLAGRQSMDPGEVAQQVERFLLKAAGQAVPDGPGQGYDAALRTFVRVDGDLPSGVVEAMLLRKVFGDPWLALDGKVRSHLMEQVKRDVEASSRWLPDARHQVLDEEGRGVVGEGAGAFGSYLCASSVVAIGARIYRLQLPARAYSLLGATLTALTSDSFFARASRGFSEAAPTAERGRAITIVAYVHLIRAIQFGDYERDHDKLVDALAAAEVALTGGKKRIERLREARSEIVIQGAGVTGVAFMLVAAIAYGIWSLLQ